MAIEQLPPGWILILGAALVPLLPRPLKQVVLLHGFARVTGRIHGEITIQTV